MHKYSTQYKCITCILTTFHGGVLCVLSINLSFSVLLCIVELIAVLKCSPYSHKHIHTTYKWIYVECASRWLSLVSLCDRPSVRRHHRRCIKWRELHVVVTFRICAKAMCRWPQIHTSIHIYARRTYNNNATYICLLQRKQRKKASTLRTHTRINNSSNRNGKRSKGGVQQSKVVYFAKKHNYTNKHASKPIIHPSSS